MSDERVNEQVAEGLNRLLAERKAPVDAEDVRILLTALERQYMTHETSQAYDRLALAVGDSPPVGGV